MENADIQRLSERIAVVEERMNSNRAEMNAHQAEYRTDLANYIAETRTAFDRISQDIAKRDADMASQTAKRDVDMAKRENRLIIVILGGIGLATTILGVIITVS